MADPIKSPSSRRFKPPGWARPLVVGLIGGMIGGIIAIYAINDYFSLVTDRSRQVVLEESSAIIDVASELGPSVVSIVTEEARLDLFGRTTSQEVGAGSGIIISSSGLILTNKHVVGENPTKITVFTSDNREFADATVIARDPFNDLAYIKINATDLKPSVLGDSDQVVVGQRVVAIGNALGELDNTVTSGIISGLGRPVIAEGATEAERLQDLFQTDAAINPGNSGGPLVNIEGKVIAINTAVAGDGENIGFAIPINQAKPGIASIERTGRLEKAYIGVRYVNIDRDIAKDNDLAVDQGAYVIGNQGQPAILSGSPAAKAGLQEKDIITKVNDEDITRRRSLATLINKFQAGETIRLTILRSGQESEVSVTLEVLPES